MGSRKPGGTWKTTYVKNLELRVWGGQTGRTHRESQGERMTQTEPQAPEKAPPEDYRTIPVSARVLRNYQRWGGGGPQKD